MKNIIRVFLLLHGFVYSQQLPLYTSSQLRTSTFVIDGSFSNDEKKVFLSSNETGVFNVNEVTIDTKISRPITKSKTDFCFSIGQLPESNNVLYSSDNGGDENTHIFLTDTNDKTSKDVTPWPNTRNNFIDWSHDKKAFYIASNKRNPQSLDIWKLDTKTFEPKLIFQNDSLYTVSGISKSERYISLAQSITDNIDQLFIYDVAKKTKKEISNGRTANWRSFGFSNNSSKFYYTTNHNAEFKYLMIYDIKTGKSEKLFETNWDIALFELSKKETYRSIFINEDGKNKVLLFNNKTNQLVDFPNFPDGSVSDVIISDSEKKFLITVSSSTSTPNLYVYDITTKKLTKITATQNKEVDENNLVRAQIVRFKSFDGLEIPAILYKPLNANAKNKVPALINVHGGPGGQTRIGFDSNIQYLVNHGYAVLCVNNRGSNGYGKTFFKLDDKDHGNGDLKDCIWGKKWLETQDFIDKDAIGIDGGSYGGTMVLNALCMYPNEFKLGVNRYGVSNFLRTLKNFPAFNDKNAFFSEMGNPYTQDSIHLKKISPIYNYQNINKPLIVFHGANDVRVLQVESDEIVAGLKKNKIPVEYILYPNEGHGFLKRENQIMTDEKTLQFLDQYLKPKKIKLQTN